MDGPTPSPYAHLIEDMYRLLDFDWRREAAVGQSVYLLDASTPQILLNILQKPRFSSLDNINHSLFSQQVRKFIKCYIEPPLRQDLMVQQVIVISQTMNRFIFKQLEFKGIEIKRKIGLKGGKKQYQLHPQSKNIEFVSPITIHSGQRFKTLTTTVYQSEDLHNFATRIRQQLKDSTPDQQFRVYSVDSQLFRQRSLRSTIQMFVDKQHMNYSSADAQRLSDKMRCKDEFSIDCLPGKRVEWVSRAQSKGWKDSRLVVEACHEGKWVFPEQNSDSRAAQCGYCCLYSQLYLSYDCSQCGQASMFCSRVCHYEALRDHPCPPSRQMLAQLYGDSQPRPQKPKAPNPVIYSSPSESKGTKPVNSSTNSKNNLQWPPMSLPEFKFDQSMIKGTLPFKIPTLPTPFKDLTQFTPVSLSASKNMSQSSLKTKAVSGDNKRRVGGLANIKNTCYINSSLQLLMTTPLHSQIRPHLQRSPRQLLGMAYRNFIKTLRDKGSASLEQMQNFKSKVNKFIPRFKGHGQQDSHEFLMAFLDQLSTQISTHSSNGQQMNFQAQSARESWLFQVRHRQCSPIVNLFSGQKESINKCLDCGYRSVKYQSFKDLQLSLPEYQETVTILYQPKGGKFQSIKMEARQTVGHIIQMMAISVNAFSADHLALLQVSREGYVEQLSMSQLIDVSQAELEGLQGPKLLLVHRDPNESFMVRFKFIRTASSKNRDQTGTSFTFKRPFYFDMIPSGAKLYDTVEQWVSGLVRAYRQVYDLPLDHQTVRKNMKENRLVYFQLQLKWNNPSDIGGVIQFQGPGITISPQDSQSIDLLGEPLCEVEVHIFDFTSQTAARKSSMNKLYQMIMTEPNKHQGPPEKAQKLLDLIKSDYSREETLDGDNRWQCPGCQTRQQAIKKMNVYRAPSYLIMQLSRSQSNGRKNHTLVDIPLNLDLKGVLVQNQLPEAYYEDLSRSDREQLNATNISLLSTTKFSLKAVVMQVGLASAGHYTALVKEWMSSQWHTFNDQLVKEVNIKEELRSDRVKSNSYVLLYQRATSSDSST